MPTWVDAHCDDGAMPRTRAFRCEVCSQPTSRLFGVVAAVEMPDHVPSGRSTVLGYCARHKAEVVPGFLESLANEGTPQLVSDPPVELRPAEAEGFLALADGVLSGAIGDVGGTEGFRPVADRSEIPEKCPHCQGRLSWGTGPHVREAGRRPGVVAWECLDCRAAGMLLGAPTA